MYLVVISRDIYIFIRILLLFIVFVSFYTCTCSLSVNAIIMILNKVLSTSFLLVLFIWGWKTGKYLHLLSVRLATAFMAAWLIQEEYQFDDLALFYSR